MSADEMKINIRYTPPELVEAGQEEQKRRRSLAQAPGSESPQYEFTRCGGIIMLMVPRFTDHGGPPNGEIHHGISEKTARQLRDQLNALLPPN